MKKYLIAILCTVMLMLAGCIDRDKAFSVGEQTDNKYESSWMGLSFSPDKAGLTLTPRSELERVMKLNSRAEKKNPKTGKTYIDYSVINSVYELYAKGELGDVLITANKLAGSPYEPTQYLTTRYINKIKKRFKDKDIKFTHSITKDVTFAGRTYHRLDIELTTELGNTTRRRIYVAKIRDRVANIFIDYKDNDGLSAIESCFSELAEN